MAKRKKKNIRSKEKLSIDHPVKATQRSWPKKNIIEYVFVSLLSTYIIADFLPVFGYAYILKPTLNYIWLSLIGISSLSLIWINRRNLKGNTLVKIVQVLMRFFRHTQSLLKFQFWGGQQLISIIRAYGLIWVY